jgi:hypothetical protein
VLEDPARFDTDEVNRELRSPYFVLREAGIDPRLVDLVNRLTYSSVGEDLSARVVRLIGEPAVPLDGELKDALRAFAWFLDRAADGGLPLTAAGYLKPADVQAAAEVVPTMHDWIGKANREIETTPVLIFRELLQKLGLLRKYKGSLKLTKAGKAARVSTDALWETLVGKLVTADDTGFDGQAALLTLAYAATSVTSDGRPAAEDRSRRTTFTTRRLSRYWRTSRPRSRAGLTADGSAPPLPHSLTQPCVEGRPSRAGLKLVSAHAMTHPGRARS